MCRYPILLLESSGKVQSDELRRILLSLELTYLDFDGIGTVNDFEVGGKLGEGSYGLVRRGVHKTDGKEVALKFFGTA